MKEYYVECETCKGEGLCWMCEGEEIYEDGEDCECCGGSNECSDCDGSGLEFVGNEVVLAFAVVLDHVEACL